MSTFKILLMMTLALASAPAVVYAESGQTEPTPRRGGADSACVDVEVDGYRGLSYDCLGKQLAGPEKPRRHGDVQASEMTTRRAPNQLGLANPAATSNRMGSNFGRSAFPQRPPTPVYSVPLPGPRP